MNKLLVFFLFVFPTCALIGVVIEGADAIGFATTILRSPLSHNTTVVQVDSTADFLDLGEVWVSDEKMLYVSKNATQFNVLVRGAGGTVISLHVPGEKVHNRNSNIFYNVLGFNIGVSSSIFGTFMTLASVVIKTIRMVPKIIAWDYAFLDGSVSIIKYLFLYPLSAGFIFALALYVRHLIIP